MCQRYTSGNGNIDVGNNSSTDESMLRVGMLSLDDLVEVSGYINEGGDFYAILIEVENDENEMKLRGNVSALDTNAQTFKINELLIDYSGTELDDMTEDDLADEIDTQDDK